MPKRILMAATAALLATPALAQSIPTSPNTTGHVSPGTPGVVTQQPGSTGAEDAATISPTGRPQDGAAPDSAAGGNAGQPSRTGSTGSGGGGAGNGGGG
ncbi:hypothetical protein [Methylobacterium brachiatum]|uniref:hypothetical protein n=1 Tax=Methylobacterium brachiatum TaxID=269660 RepID=UPI0008ED6C53|nr:hypothetical protein [Methylobacterium brachiatum]MDH2311524.1 hypothetical protein [Methylobacterium brachiatum]SFJ73930.1 hypothetical protein SAMN02799642_05345 [Methylobacterium brachiatum]